MEMNEKTKIKAVYVIAVFFAILFIVFKADFLAIAGALMFIIGVIYESMVNVKEKGFKDEIKEIVIAVIVAIVLWNVSTFVLNTSSPFNAVVSCSMLNALHRGDVIVLQGSEINVPEINLSKEEFDFMTRNGEEHYICGFCKYGDEYQPCAINPATGAKWEGSVLNYDCGVCTQEYYDQEREIACTKGVFIKGTYFDASKKEGDVIVYRPKQGDVFAPIGDIIHRAVVRINVDGEQYYLVKGDNNPMFDAQAFDRSFSRSNSIVNSSQVLGKSIFSVPYLGYIKLTATGQFANPENCNTLLHYEK